MKGIIKYVGVYVDGGLLQKLYISIYAFKYT